MADLNVVHRRSLAWLWWLLGALLLGVLLWIGTTLLSAGDPEPRLETDPNAEVITPTEPMRR